MTNSKSSKSVNSKSVNSKSVKSLNFFNVSKDVTYSDSKPNIVILKLLLY